MKIKRILSLLLILVIVFAALPHPNALALSAPSSASELASRFSSIKSGTYGTGKSFRNNQNLSCTFNSSVAGRSGNCHNGHVGFNFVNDSYCNCKVATADIAGTAGGIQCFGYARYVFYQLFGLSLATSYGANLYTLSSTTNVTSVGSTSSNSSSTAQTILSKAWMGDIIQAKTSSGGMHTMIVETVSGTGVTVLDCNYSGQCSITTRTIAWSSFASSYKAFTIYRSKNHPGQATVERPTPGVYQVTTSSGLTLRAGAGTSYSSLAIIPLNTKLNVTQKVSAGGYTWGKTSYNGKEGWATLEYTTYVGPMEPKLQISRWVSEKGQGYQWNQAPEATSFVTGKQYYLWYRIFDGNTNKGINEDYKWNYQVELQFINPNGSVLYSYKYGNSDNNWIGSSFNTPGAYKCRWIVTGDVNGTYDSNIYVVSSTYTIAYNANGGSGTPASQTKTNGAALKLSMAEHSQ